MLPIVLCSRWCWTWARARSSDKTYYFGCWQGEIKVYLSFQIAFWSDFTIRPGAEATFFFTTMHSQIRNLQGFFKVVGPLFRPLLQVQLARETFADLATESFESNKFTDLTTGSGPRAGAWLR